MIEVRVPDIGDFDQVDVVEVLVTPGKRVEADESLITLESEKASMDVPSPSAGVVKEIAVKVGDKVGEGDLIVKIEADGEGEAKEEPQPAKAETKPPAKEEATPAKEDAKPAPAARPEERAEGTAPQEVDAEPPKPSRAAPPPEPTEPAAESGPAAHASPSVRQFARDLGVEVAKVSGSGPKGRILREDVQAFVKRAMTAPAKTAAAATATGGAIPSIPVVDFSKFGEIEEVPLSRIRLRAKENLHRS